MDLGSVSASNTFLKSALLRNPIRATPPRLHALSTGSHRGWKASFVGGGITTGAGSTRQTNYSPGDRALASRYSWPCFACCYDSHSTLLALAGRHMGHEKHFGNGCADPSYKHRDKSVDW